MDGQKAAEAVAWVFIAVWFLYMAFEVVRGIEGW